MKKLLPAFILLLIFAACSEDDPGSESNYTKLTEKDWTQSGWIITYTIGVEEDTIDLYNNAEAYNIEQCILDDYIVFRDDHSYQTKPGADICNTNLSMFGNGNWQISGDSISIEPYNNTAAKFYLDELSDGVLKFSQYTDLPFTIDGQPITITGHEFFTYKY